MRGSRESLIATLAEEGRAVRDARRIGLEGAVWLVLGALLVCVLIALTGPWRPGSVDQLLATPQFAIEIVLGAAAAAALAVAAFRSAVPAPVGPILWLALLLAAAWFCTMLYGFADPALAPSMSGKREHCALETLAWGLPAMLLGMIALRRWWPLRGALSGALLGLAAGIIPAVAMQLACMYAPLHGLTHHALPGMALALPGALLGSLALRRQPRSRPG